MSTRMKHRLLGLVVILLAVAILLPLLFRNSSDEQTKALVTHIPTPPKSPAIGFVEPSQNQDIPAIAANSVSNKVSQSQDAGPSVVVSDESLSKQVAAPQAAVVLPSSDKPSKASVIEKEKKISLKPPVVAKKTAKQPPLKHSDQVKPSSAHRRVKAIKPMVEKDQKNESSLMGLDTPRAWVIQLASFSEVSNADRLVNRLRAKGYNAYDRVTTTPSGQQIVRVFVGPDINFDQINGILKKLQTQFGLKGIVKRYQL